MQMTFFFRPTKWRITPTKADLRCCTRKCSRKNRCQKKWQTCSSKGTS